MKSWPATPENVARAAEQVQYLQRMMGADHAYVVLPGLADSDPSSGVLSVNDLVPTLEGPVGVDTRTRGRSPKKVPISKKKVFAAMPFSAEYDDVFFVAIVEAAKRVRVTCERVDGENISGDVVDKIKSGISTSDIVIADLSEARPNVLYELGYAHALDRPTIHISSTPLEDLPFDIRNWGTHRYEKGRTHLLKNFLIGRLKDLLANLPTTPAVA